MNTGGFHLQAAGDIAVAATAQFTAGDMELEFVR